MPPPSSVPSSARGAARRVTPAAWARALLGLVAGALPGGAFLAARGLLAGDGLWTVLAVGMLLYFLSLPLAAWQFGRRVRLGMAWGYVGGVIIATGALLVLFFSARAPLF